MDRRQRLTIVATGFGMFMVFLDALVVNVALPELQETFDIGEAGAQAVVTAYSVGMAVTIMWSATLADLRGRRRVYLVSVVVFVASSVLCGVAPSFAVLVVGRALQGLAAGPITVASLALVSAAFTDDHLRTRAVGIWSAVGSIGTALGPSIGGILVEGIGWRSVFLVNVPVGAAILALSLSAVAESRDPSDRSFDHRGQVSFAAAVAAVALALIVAPQQGWLSLQVITLTVVFAVSLVAFVRRERTTDDPMIDLDLFRRPVYTTSLGVLFVLFFAAYGSLLMMTQYLQNVRDDSAIVTGFVVLPFSLGIVSMAPNAARIAKGLGRRRAVLLAILLSTVGYVLETLGLSGAPLVIAAGALLVGWGFGLALVPLTALSMSTVPDTKAGMASGVLATQRAIGSTAGYALFGSILALWVGARLDDRLADTVPESDQRAEVAAAIEDQANPSAFVAEIGPRQPLDLATRFRESEILSVADDVFVRGMQLAMAVGVVAIIVIGVVAWRVLPADRPIARRSASA